MKRADFLGTAVVLGALAIVAGCASAQPISTKTSTDAGSGAIGHAAGAAGEPCAPNGPLTLVEPPADFVPVKATQCVERNVDIPGDGTWRVRDDQLATGGLAALVRALRLPSQPAKPDQGCTAIGHTVPLITLIDAHGHKILTDYPTQPCGDMLPEVRAALNAMTWKTTDEKKIEQLGGELANTSGCQQEYKGVIALAAASSSGNRVPGSAPAKLSSDKICRYDVDPANAMHLGSPNGPAIDNGTLASAGTLSDSTAKAFTAAVSGAPAAGACTKPQGPFAVIGDYTVELNGCYRVLDPAGSLRQLTAADVAPLR